MTLKVKNAQAIRPSWFPALIFIGWAGVYAWLLISGDYRNFVGRTLWPMMLLGMLVNVCFGLGSLLSRARWQSGSAVSQFWLSGLVLLMPLLFILAANNHTLGSYALTKRSLDFADSTVDGLQPTPTPVTAPSDYGRIVGTAGAEFSDGVNHVNLLEIKKYNVQLKGHRLITRGMVHRGEGTPDGQFVLFRFAISCCIADSRPVAVLVDYAQCKSLAENQWVQVEGVLETKRVPGLRRINIRAEQVKGIPEPAANDRYMTF